YPPVNRQWELEFIRLLNEERARHGLHPLREHPLLTLAARRHAYDVGINQMSRGPEYCSHTGTDGTWPWHRMEWAGYPGRYDGEAIHCGTHDVASAVRSLLESPPHRAFLLSPIPVEVGVGVHPIISDVEWRRGSHSTVMLGGTPNP
ncbi:MAG: CAP domain-containing protein, partial [Roseiflexus sp.]|nr:CAP domain-containing protein [Roseiflexus sp.]